MAAQRSILNNPQNTVPRVLFSHQKQIKNYVKQVYCFSYTVYIFLKYMYRAQKELTAVMNEFLKIVTTSFSLAIEVSAGA